MVSRHNFQDSLKRTLLRTPLGPPLRSVYRLVIGKRESTAPISPAQQLLEQHIAELEKTNPHAHLHRYHLKRYATSLELIPNASGKLLDLGGYKGLFRELVKEYRPGLEQHFADNAHPDPNFRCNVETHSRIAN